MKLEFWGAARTVTGSMHLLEANGRRLLLDCGLYQGRRKQAFERNRDFPFDPASIDAVLLSHAHIDHSGNLPTLVRAGFRGQVFATSATRDLCALMLLDSAKIQESDVRRANRRRRKRGKKLFEPLYTGEDAVETLQRFASVEYDRPLTPLLGRGSHSRFRQRGRRRRGTRAHEASAVQRRCRKQRPSHSKGSAHGR
jgi:metallo-beta-lactamase family protein